MQTQAPVAGPHGQLPHGQLPQHVRGGFPLPKQSLAGWRKAWHNDDDVNLRREIIAHITKLLLRRRLENRLPDIANDLEMALYLDAVSKEEYGDLNTLENRIFSLIIRLRNNQNSAQHGVQPGSVMSNITKVPTPHRTVLPPGSNMSFPMLGTGSFPSSHSGSRVFLNPGGATTAVGYGISNVGPTAGFNNSLFASAIGEGPSVGLCGSDFERNGTPMSSSGVPRAGSQMIPTPGLNIRSPPARLPFHNSGVTTDGYAMMATDLAESGKLYNHSLPTGLVVGNNASSLVVTQAKMVPVPGLLPEQKGLMLSQHSRPQPSLISHSGASLQSPGFTVLPQQQQPGLSAIQEQRGIKECSTEILDAHVQHPLRALPDQDTLDMLTGQQHPSQVQRDQVSLLPHVQVEQAFQTRGNQDIGWMEKDHQKDLGLGKELHCSSDPHKLQHPCQPGISTDQQGEHSEQTCQANSADTGQSEVVSNDESLAPGQVNRTGSSIDLQQVKRQQWLLIFLRHVSRCSDSAKCTVTHCEVGRQSWKHLTTCRVFPCSHPRCTHLKGLLKHHNSCRNSKCVVCGPVRTYFARQSNPARSQKGKGMDSQPTGTVRCSAAIEVESPPMKRVKLEVPAPSVPQLLQQAQQSMSTVESQEQTSVQDTLSTLKDDFAQSPALTKDVELTSNRLGKGKVGLSSLKVESPTGSSLSTGSHLQGNTKLRLVSNIKSESNCMKENSVLQVAGPANLQTSQEASAVVSLKISPNSAKPAKAKVSGISYIELFTPQQIREHISSLRKWTGQSKGKAERNQAMEHQMSSAACSACAVENLSFDPIPIFCTQCGCRIKRNATYHTSGSGETSLNFCGPCYSAIRADMLETDGFKVQKSTLEKRKNDEQRLEAWVECDKCKKWQHQICVLFNARINKERSEYICPECCIADVERGERMPGPSSSVVGAKDLPRTVLSDHVEERLAQKLKQERVERAKALGKSPEEVQTAEGLVVRVVSSVEKKLDVKQKFLELFQHEGYPKDFLYKSKMLMLFQEIEGVEVCLFGMYVQEFGAENPQPNQRRVYISYLDSVKYFRPEVKTLSGEALRTYVYHEILIAYLDYCKKRGFSSCYIWACPPLKGDDYILYCHPEIQKTPKTDKLREWYLTMIAKAKKESIVVANKNLYDYFFTSNGECKAKVTAARLPYFDGDYWPGAAEDILQQLQQEEEGVHSQRRGKVKKVVTKRSTKTSSHAELAGNVSRDLQLMHKLGQSIFAMKEDFIMVHMHHACSHCRNFITSGHRWFCQQCAGNFQLCSCCYEVHQRLGEEERHPASKECHPLIREEVDDVPTDTLDRDEIMESEFFDNRHAFLSLCQGNQYQYDTLRRAKHSSMMVLYHLHNPNAPAFITSCTICHAEIEAGQGWKCKSCTDFDVCSSCFSSQEVQKHPHKFVARSAAADQSAANKDARQQRILQLRTMLEVLKHASQCREPSCQYGKCRNMKDLFRHGISCTKRAIGGCSLCKRMWFLLAAHARSCRDTPCSVPRCMDLREHARRTQLQQESRRRAAVNEMIRQRAAEAAGGSQ